VPGNFAKFTDDSQRLNFFGNTKKLHVQPIPADMRLISLLVHKLTESRFVIRKSKSGNVIRSLMSAGISCTGAVPVRLSREKHFFRPQLDNAALRAGPDSELIRIME
jgi:hypothetical protein